MHGAHNMGYAEYSRRLDTRLQVEQKRQREFEESRKMIEQVDRQLHR